MVKSKVKTEILHSIHQLSAEGKGGVGKIIDMRVKCKL